MSDYPVPGYHGRVLVADLGRGEVRTEALAPELALDHLGGRGLATRLLYDTIDPACDPLGPENAFAIASSPLVGTSAPTAGRGHMVFKSPLTGVLGTSNSGGTWGAAFKSAGYDALVVTGAAATPVMIDIAPGRAEILPADGLWGKTTHETSDALAAASEPGRPARVLCIGPAGENLVRFAAVANDSNRVYGRCGPGAVWGSKKLKAIRVRPGEDRDRRQREVPVRPRPGPLSHEAGAGDQAPPARPRHGRPRRADQPHRHAAAQELPGLRPP